MNEIDSIHPLGPLNRGTLRHRIVQRLLKAIIQGELPAGTRLVANKVAVRLGVSATPIREALVELGQFGIVELLHHRGALVKPFGRDELRDFYAVRRLLECDAARLACGHVDQELLCPLRCDLERLIGDFGDGRDKWVTDFLAVDRQVHAMVVGHCSNKRLIAEIDRYNTLGEAMRDIVGDNRSGHHESIGPLMDLLKAMQNHQVEAAAAGMGRHINIVAAMVETVMFDGKEQVS